MQAREYPFLNSNVPRIFDDLLEANLIDLLEMKQPKEVKRNDDPKYCKYHRLVGHVIQDCFLFMDKVMQVARQESERILIDGGSTGYVCEQKPPHDPRLQSRRTKGCRQCKNAIDYEDMVSSALFYVIDAKTSYNMFLGRPGLHENTVVPST
ncbi:hypothetical protein Sango_0252900 [Sesamum angolense]|uniref:Retrotransposon gag protein n=1 Tax=Sesamum angolense TaxID=2727404 RepID=A0AAE2C7E5_9LAMI|nr:hypothetical protein Sango_0252900 [Sesamum angolense]